MKKASDGKCAICGGRKARGQTLFATEVGQGILVVRNVPALVCGQCGEEWLEDAVVVRLEALANDARARGIQLEVVTLSGVA